MARVKAMAKGMIVAGLFVALLGLLDHLAHGDVWFSLLGAIWAVLAVGGYVRFSSGPCSSRRGKDG